MPAVSEYVEFTICAHFLESAHHIKALSYSPHIVRPQLIYQIYVKSRTPESVRGDRQAAEDEIAGPRVIQSPKDGFETGEFHGPAIMVAGP